MGRRSDCESNARAGLRSRSCPQGDPPQVHYGPARLGLGPQGERVSAGTVEPRGVEFYRADGPRDETLEMTGLFDLVESVCPATRISISAPPDPVPQP